MIVMATRDLKVRSDLRILGGCKGLIAWNRISYLLCRIKLRKNAAEQIGPTPSLGGGMEYTLVMCSAAPMSFVDTEAPDFSEVTQLALATGLDASDAAVLVTPGAARPFAGTAILLDSVFDLLKVLHLQLWTTSKGHRSSTLGLRRPTSSTRDHKSCALGLSSQCQTLFVVSLLATLKWLPTGRLQRKMWSENLGQTQTHQSHLSEQPHYPPQTLPNLCSRQSSSHQQRLTV